MGQKNREKENWKYLNASKNKNITQNLLVLREVYSYKHLHLKEEISNIQYNFIDLITIKENKLSPNLAEGGNKIRAELSEIENGKTFEKIDYEI